MVQNAAAPPDHQPAPGRLRSPYSSTALHWLLIAAHIHFQALVLAFQAAKGTAHIRFQELALVFQAAQGTVHIHFQELALAFQAAKGIRLFPAPPAGPLHSASSRGLLVPSLRTAGGGVARSLTGSLFWFLRGGKTCLPLSEQLYPPPLPYTHNFPLLYT